MERITTLVATLAVFTYAWASCFPILASSASAEELHRFRRSPKVAGGSLASITEFPYAVQLIIFRADGLMQCGGSIIRPNIVLTAAHCVETLPDTLSGRGSDTLGIIVIAGESTFVGSGPTSQRRLVIKIRRHPHFNAVTLLNDLAVLLLQEPFDLDGTFVSQLALPLGTWQSFSGKAKVCGWGLISDRRNVSNSNSELRKAELRLVSNTVCDSYFTRFESAIELCAGGDGPGKACTGDSGGPLVCHVNSQSDPYLCGVASSGDGCKPKNGPGVYVRVSAFVPWIETQILELGGQPQPQQQPSYPRPSPPTPTPYPHKPLPNGTHTHADPPQSNGNGNCSSGHAIRPWLWLSDCFLHILITTNFLLY